MSVISRKVKNKKDADGISTGHAGTVYDVSFRYKTPDGESVTYNKRGFATKAEAAQHEAEMKVKFATPAYAALETDRSKQTVEEFMWYWLDIHGKANLRPSTIASYKGTIKTHIVPELGNIQLRNLTPEMIDRMLQKMFDKGLSPTTVRYAQRVLSVSLEHARKYHYIATNPARDIITKFGKAGKTPAPYTIQELQQLLSYTMGGVWEMPVMLSGLYGLRLGEILGLRWKNVDLKNRTFSVVEQIPYNLPVDTVTLTEMAPLKSEERTLYITDAALTYFQKQKAMQDKKKLFCKLGGSDYYDNDLVVCKPDGRPLLRDRMSTDFAQMLRRTEMRHIRFHDLRHSAATNMHELTGDFFTVGKILGHSLKGMGLQLGISTNLEATTAQYIDVRLDRIRVVLDAYHKVILPDEKETEKGRKKEPRKNDYCR